MKLFYKNIGKRIMLSLFAALLAVPAVAQQSKVQAAIPYAVYDEATCTLYFKWGVPTGTVNVDYYLADYTSGRPRWSWVYQHNPSPVQKNAQKVVFEPDFANARPTLCNYWFYNFQKLTSIEGMEYLNTSECVDMDRMFNMCISLERVDVSWLNTKKVTNMTQMFCNCDKLISLTFGKDFSTQSIIPEHNTCGSMFANDNKLRFIDFLASDEIHAITEEKASFMFNAMQANLTKVIYLPHGSQDITTQRNFVYSYNGDASDLRCPYYYSKDSVDIEFPYDFRTNRAEYIRAMKGKTKGTVILPYAFTSTGDVCAYTLQKEYDNFMWFESTLTVPAHTPFVFRKLKEYYSSANFTQTDSSGNFGITVYATRDTKLQGAYSVDTPLGGWSMKGFM